MRESCAVHTNQNVGLSGVADLFGDGQRGEVDGQKSGVKWEMGVEGREKGALREEAAFGRAQEEG